MSGITDHRYRVKSTDASRQLHLLQNPDEDMAPRMPPVVCRTRCTQHRTQDFHSRGWARGEGSSPFPWASGAGQQPEYLKPPNPYDYRCGESLPITNQSER